MDTYAWFVVAFLIGVVCGLAFPRLCPRCKLEKIWIRELKKPHVDKPTKPDA
jgi:Na+/H+-dicarboxylate symporter